MPDNPEQLAAFMRGETGDPGWVRAVRGGVQFPQPDNLIGPGDMHATLDSDVAAWRDEVVRSLAEQLDIPAELLTADMNHWTAGMPPHQGGPMPATTTPRPSVHDPVTKSYAIDQITDIERLRAVAHRMWEAFFSAHAQAAHAIAVLKGYEECTPCTEALNGGECFRGCERWQAWQAKVTDGFGSV